MIRLAAILFLCSLAISIQAQYNPSAQQIGTHAIHMDSSIIRDWATSCVLQRGWRNILDTTLGKTTVGDENSATGKALKNGVVSLGDGGSAVLTFAGKIYNGPGPDFAVFENGFDEYFLELAFVEVSSDGRHFFRFPAHSLTDDSTQVGGFDSLYASQLNNLAGKYQQTYGVPFDLEEMKGITGLDVDHISHIKIIDVIGIIDSPHSTYDKDSNVVNDPFPTAFPSGGFDLDAIGAIHLRPASLDDNLLQSISFYPNPAIDFITIKHNRLLMTLEIYDLNGKTLLSKDNPSSTIDVAFLPEGVYVISLTTNKQRYTTQFIKQ